MLTDEEGKALTRQVEALARRVRVSNMLAVGALAVAVAGGTAWAASRYLITSTKQIKPSVLAQIERSGAQTNGAPPGSSEVQGPQGPQGEQGPGGPQGPQGVPGPSGTSSTAGFSASSGYVALSNRPDVLVPAVSKILPAGNFIADGSVTVSVYAVDATDWLVTCEMTDTPAAGPPVTDTVSWQAVTTYDVMFSTPSSASNTLPFEEAIDSPNSASTLSLSCEAAGDIPGSDAQYGPNGAMESSTETAIETNTNG
jgi:hypothetical protein